MDSSSNEELYKRREERKRRKIKYIKYTSFKNYIPKCLHRMGLTTDETPPSISENAAYVIDDIVMDIFHQIMTEAKLNMMRTYKRTLTVEDVTFAVLTCFEGEVARHAVVEGRKAVDMYTGHLARR